MIDHRLGRVARRMNAEYREYREKRRLWIWPRPKSEFKKRDGGGKAALVHETGNYRPAVTHNTYCPNEKRWRNVAILANAGNGRKWLNCEVCGWQWIYREETAPNPLVPGYKSFFSSQLMTPLDGQTRYTNPTRGA